MKEWNVGIVEDWNGGKMECGSVEWSDKSDLSDGSDLYFFLIR